FKPIDSGSLSGLTESEAAQIYPEVMEKKERYRNGRLNGFDLEYPGGERVKDFQERVMSTLFDVICQRAYDQYCVVGHQSTITAILSFFKSENNNNPFYYYFKLDFCSISTIKVSDLH